MKGGWLKKGLGLFWAASLLLVLLFWWRSEIPLRQIPELLEGWLRQFGLYRAALCYVLLYTLRPLILFPATLLTVASGLLFGPWLGILFTIIGENASANFAFLIARWFGRDWVARHEPERLRHWEERLCRNGILTVMIMRLIYLPFDAVNYGCGLTGMAQRDFAVGTFLGIMPALISFVLLGGIGAAGMTNRLLLLGLSLLFLLLGLWVARWLGRREASKES